MKALTCWKYSSRGSNEYHEGMCVNRNNTNLFGRANANIGDDRYSTRTPTRHPANRREGDAASHFEARHVGMTERREMAPEAPKCADGEPRVPASSIFAAHEVT